MGIPLLAPLGRAARGRVVGECGGAVGVESSVVGECTNTSAITSPVYALELTLAAVWQ